MNNPFEGSYVALPTPLRSGALDLTALRGLIDEHAAAGTAGVVACGTTGEAATLRDAERREVVGAVVEACAGRLSVIAGVGTTATWSSIERACEARDAGVDGLLVVTPYYNRPSRAGLAAHFEAVARATELPVVLYNVPSRTACDLDPELAKELARSVPNIVAIKEATLSVERIEALAGEPSLALLCGEDSSLVDFLRVGGVGAINVTGNVAPGAFAELIQCGRAGDEMRATELAGRLAPLVHDLFLESNPVPVKAALAWLGRCTDEVREPLAPMIAANRERLERTLSRFADELCMAPA